MDSGNTLLSSSVTKFIIEIIISGVNVVMIVIIASKCVYKLQIPFLAADVCFVYILSYTPLSYFMIQKYREIDESMLEGMRYSTRCMFLSQISFVFGYKILCAIAYIVTKFLVAVIGFSIWMVVGDKSTISGSIGEFIASLNVSNMMVNVYNTVSTWLERVFVHFFDYELKIVDKLIGRGIKEKPNACVDPDEYAEARREAYRQNIEKAKNGNSKAQLIVGKYCMNYGSHEEAVKWFIRAANSGEASAYTKLGYCYINGIGVDADTKKAINLYKKAAAMQDTSAMCFLADYFIAKSNRQETITAAVKLYAKAAGLGDANAQEHLGVIYYEGRYIGKNDSQAYLWLKKSVEERGNYHSGYYLAKCYLDGTGTEADSRKGFCVLKKTVEKDGGHFAECLELLSQCYQNGTGVSRNIYLARIYRQKAKRYNQLISSI